MFSANYTSRYDVDPSGFTFLANAYDAAYIGAAGTVYAATSVPAYDGRHVVSGLARLIIGDAGAGRKDELGHPREQPRQRRA